MDATLVGVHHGELVGPHGHLLSGPGDAAEGVQDQPGDRLVLLLLGKLPLEAFVELLDPRAAVDQVASVGEPHELGGGFPVVRDLPDDLLDDVPERHDALARAILVHDDRELDAPALHLRQEVADPLGGRDVVRRAHERADRLPGGAPGQDVEGRDHAHDVVDALPVHRQPRVPALPDRRDRLVDARVLGHRDDVDQRHHDLPDGRLGEVEDPLDHLPLFLPDVGRPVRLALDQEAEIGAGDEGIPAVAVSEAPQDRAHEEVGEAHDGGQEPGHPPERVEGAKGDAGRARLRERLREDLAEDEHGRREDDRRPERGLASDPGEEGGGRHRRRDDVGDGDTHHRGGQEPLRVLEGLHVPAGHPRALLGQVTQPHPVGGQERDLGRREESRGEQADEDDAPAREGHDRVSGAAGAGGGSALGSAVPTVGSGPGSRTST